MSASLLLLLLPVATFTPRMFTGSLSPISPTRAAERSGDEGGETPPSAPGVSSTTTTPPRLSSPLLPSEATSAAPAFEPFALPPSAAASA